MGKASLANWSFIVFGPSLETGKGTGKQFKTFLKLIFEDF
jgi:hypothetical protein